MVANSYQRSVDWPLLSRVNAVIFVRVEMRFAAKQSERRNHKIIKKLRRIVIRQSIRYFFSFVNLKMM